MRNAETVVVKCWKLDTELERWIMLQCGNLDIPETEEPTPMRFPNAFMMQQAVFYGTTATVLYQALMDTMHLSEGSLVHDEKKHPHVYAHRSARSTPCFIYLHLLVSGEPSQSRFPQAVRCSFSAKVSRISLV